MADGTRQKAIETIDPRLAISFLFLPSVKEVPRGDGSRLPRSGLMEERRGGGWGNVLTETLGPSRGAE